MDVSTPVLESILRDSEGFFLMCIVHDKSRRNVISGSPNSYKGQVYKIILRPVQSLSSSFICPRSRRIPFVHAKALIFCKHRWSVYFSLDLVGRCLNVG